MMSAYSFASGEFDDLRNFDRFNEASMRLFNLGFGLDYGINSWITAGAQWVPGLSPWSDKNANANDISEIYLGAKFQVLGENAPLRSEEFRFSIAPGVFIPLMDKHIFAVGSRFYFDWLFNRNFFVNLYNETLFFPGNQDFRNAGPDFYGVSGDLDYSLSFGIGSTFTAPICDGIVLSLSLPATYRYLPVPMHNLGINPNMSLLFTDTPLPLEFKFQYDFPLWGMSSLARHNTSFQLMAYFAFGR